MGELEHFSHLVAHFSPYRVGEPTSTEKKEKPLHRGGLKVGLEQLVQKVEEILQELPNKNNY